MVSFYIFLEQSQVSCGLSGLESELPLFPAPYLLLGPPGLFSVAGGVPGVEFRPAGVAPRYAQSPAQLPFAHVFLFRSGCGKAVGHGEGVAERKTVGNGQRVAPDTEAVDHGKGVGLRLPLLVEPALPFFHAFALHRRLKFGIELVHESGEIETSLLEHRPLDGLVVPALRRPHRQGRNGLRALGPQVRLP